jgi:nucleotide-binding universal stress UspA family protein
MSGIEAQSEFPVEVHRIAVGIDGYPEGRDAAALAAGLARGTGADVLLVAILGDPLVVPTAGPGWTALHHQAETTLVEVRDTLVPNARIVIETDVSVARGLERVVGRERCDILVVGSSRRGVDGSVRIGKRARQLIGDAGCALAVAPRGLVEDGELNITRIGVGYDAGPESEAALSLAGSIARASGAELWIRAVVDDRIPTFGLAGAGGERIVAEWKELIKADVELLRLNVVDAAKRIGADARVEALSERPADALLELGADVDLLVIGSRRWGPVARLLLGSTGEVLMRDAECPIVVVPRSHSGP